MTIKGSGGGGGDIGGSGIFMPDTGNGNGNGNSDGDGDGDGGESDVKNDAGEALASLSGKRIEDVYGGEHLLRLFGTFTFYIIHFLLHFPVRLYPSIHLLHVQSQRYHLI